MSLGVARKRNIDFVSFVTILSIFTAKRPNYFGKLVPASLCRYDREANPLENFSEGECLEVIDKYFKIVINIPRWNQVIIFLAHQYPHITRVILGYTLILKQLTLISIQMRLIMYLVIRSAS